MTDKTYRILNQRGFRLVHRGVIPVKGKGQLQTYFLEGRGERKAPPFQGLRCVPHKILLYFRATTAPWLEVSPDYILLGSAPVSLLPLALGNLSKVQDRLPHVFVLSGVYYHRPYRVIQKE